MDELITQYGDGDGASVGHVNSYDSRGEGLSIGEPNTMTYEMFKNLSRGEGIGFGTFFGRGYWKEMGQKGNG